MMKTLEKTTLLPISTDSLAYALLIQQLHSATDLIKQLVAEVNTLSEHQAAWCLCGDACTEEGAMCWNCAIEALDRIKLHKSSLEGMKSPRKS